MLTEKESDVADLLGAEAFSSFENPPPPADEGGKTAQAEPEYTARLGYMEENAPPFQSVTKTPKADRDGLWLVEFKPMAASFKPKFLASAAAGQGMALKNILVGEVWVTAGQSNMALTANQSKWLDSEGLLEPGVRYVHTGRVSHYRPQQDLPQRAAWRVCDHDIADLSTWENPGTRKKILDDYEKK